MPDFVLPAEADHCPYCGAVLYDPPNCCESMEAEHQEFPHGAPAMPFDPNEPLSEVPDALRRHWRRECGPDCIYCAEDDTPTVEVDLGGDAGGA